MSLVQAWNDVVDKVQTRLSKWKLNTLSIGGRLTLLKSVLGSIPIFHMSIFRVPLGVLRMLESTRSHFFNGHVPNSKKASWVKWNNVMASREKGGLGVASLYALNRGLIFKWIWRFYSQYLSLWARVIKAIHEEDGKVRKVDHSGSRSCWLNIVHEINELEKQGIKLLDQMKFKLGMKLLDSSFRRKPRGGIEQEQFDALADQIRDVILAPTPDGLSEVATKTRWIKVVPIKVNVHAWTLKNDYLPTRFNISRRGNE
nr:RNA-directed DNA polymerase, eukaryota, reverse transcriptase zinc-binding domain protein [Tanacetum cinerariifolium]